MLKTKNIVTIATHLISNHQFIQRRIVELEWYIPDNEAIDDVYLDVLMIKEDGSGVPLIRK